MSTTLPGRARESQQGRWRNNRLRHALGLWPQDACLDGRPVQLPGACQRDFPVADPQLRQRAVTLAAAQPDDLLQRVIRVPRQRQELVPGTQGAEQGARNGVRPAEELGADQGGGGAHQGGKQGV